MLVLAGLDALESEREEDEEEGGGSGSGNESTGSAGLQNLDVAVQGLRISTSASATGISPVLGPHVLGAGRGGASPSPRRLSESEHEPVYDALNERGPGHPLFPSNFAHLSHAPTLRAS